MAATEDQHLVGDLGAGGEHEPSGAGVCAGLRGGIITVLTPALARLSRVSNQVNVLVAAPARMLSVPVRGFTCPARRAHGRMTDRTGRDGWY